MKDEKILIEIYQKMYEEATPSADFDKLMKSGEAKKEGWFLNYSLEQERQEEILDEAMKKYKVPKWKRKQFSVTVNLGCSPKFK
jgi:hypothetical protein